MSVIGPGNLGAVNLAGSAAGAQRNAAAESDRLKESGSQRSSEASLKEMSSRSLEDVGQTDESADRDADGRMPFGDGEGELAKPPENSDVAIAPDGVTRRRLIPDANGQRGRRLDIEA